MAQKYKIAADMSEREKIFGGILTLYQLVFCIIGIVLWSVPFFILSRFIPTLLAVILPAPFGITFAVLFAFKKKEDLDFLTYLRYKRVWKKKTKTLENDYCYGKTFEEEVAK